MELSGTPAYSYTTYPWIFTPQTSPPASSCIWVYMPLDPGPQCSQFALVGRVDQGTPQGSPGMPPFPMPTS